MNNFRTAGDSVMMMISRFLVTGGSLRCWKGSLPKHLSPRLNTKPTTTSRKQHMETYPVTSHNRYISLLLQLPGFFGRGLLKETQRLCNKKKTALSAQSCVCLRSPRTSMENVLSSTPVPHVPGLFCLKPIRQAFAELRGTRCHLP